MSRGFYMLGSGMISQNKILSTNANNIANVNTVGFKKDKMLSTTFGDMLLHRIDSSQTPLSPISMMRRVDENITIHSQGDLDPTDRSLDFAIAGEGFFRVRTPEGELYTRNGNFTLDDEGYLQLANFGRVLGENGEIYLGTDNIDTDSFGNIFIKNGDNSLLAGKLAIYNFADYNDIKLQNNGMYAGNNPALINYPEIKTKTLERSNVNIGQEMMETIEIQRNLQSTSQLLKMYDQTLARAVNDIGKI